MAGYHIDMGLQILHTLELRATMTCSELYKYQSRTSLFVRNLLTFRASKQ